MSGATANFNFSLDVVDDTFVPTFASTIADVDGSVVDLKLPSMSLSICNNWSAEGSGDGTSIELLRC